MGMAAWHDKETGGLALKSEDGGVIIAGRYDGSDVVFLDGDGVLYAADIGGERVDDARPDPETGGRTMAVLVRDTDSLAPPGAKHGYGALLVALDDLYDMEDGRKAVRLGEPDAIAGNYYIRDASGWKPAGEVYSGIADMMETDAMIERQGGKADPRPIDRLFAMLDGMDAGGGPEAGHAGYGPC